ncbi:MULTISPECIES: polymer-forming cytoskeletal protein [unclassified Lysobacter]|uniref:bactofilin family protein n=1 Tax=unclassified Lysobacter TaxID=2635362 RepID=UPI001BE5D7BD|nr:MULTISPECIES: polymer-forming cytoskeletal protein [unclassified Lysobacter]MBT2746478.1 polymer-forming cytoskeletal protein [Lysobacter sp. ISL-42]MBT2752980.1 polymer-forming cytoskeletal protein [Lysobacter sp. ISL-50]MBT2777657.1 polymer-forming cytoskeletal protein [Lysobacter sp. ISL-54]MBT2782428.1 polymer-forming cytoskeletal protein [Lysobacter sp. ISL-52]
MAIFNQPTPPKRDNPVPPLQPETALKREPDTANEFSFGQPSTPAPAPIAAPAPTPAPAPRQAEQPVVKESLIASDLSIEGKIHGAGHIRIAGRFKGDVQVDGDLTVELGAKLNGGVRARKVVIAGELEGNIEAAQRVELLESGVMIGDVKAGVVTVAAGARVRGQVEFGWEDSGKSVARNDAGKSDRNADKSDKGDKNGAKTETGADS